MFCFVPEMIKVLGFMTDQIFLYFKIIFNERFFFLCQQQFGSYLDTVSLTVHPKDNFCEKMNLYVNIDFLFDSKL